MVLRIKLILLLLVQLLSLGIFIVEEEYMMLVCVLLIIFIVSAVVVDMVKGWLDSRRIEILLGGRILNKKVISSIESYLMSNKSKQQIVVELVRLYLLERKQLLLKEKNMQRLKYNRKVAVRLSERVA